jgi:hypothetical protein
MMATATYPLLSNAAAKRSGSRASGVEKSKARQQFDGEYSTAQDRRNCGAAAQNRRAPCQFGTDQHASFWNGPRLRSAFAAQVLGQAMGLNQTQSASAQLAYRNSAVRLAPSFDQEL